MNAYKSRDNAANINSFELQHLILRVYLGLDFVHHFAEKFGLLGPDAYEQLEKEFRTATPTYAAALVFLAGLCEFGAFVGFTFGLFTRAAAVCTALYLLIASAIGGHFSNGFTWLNPGGGWEFPLLWIVLAFSFVLTGGGRYSVDAWLRSRLPIGFQRLSA